MKKRNQLEINYISHIDLLSGALAGFIILLVVMPHHKYRSPSSTLEAVESKTMGVGQRFKMENIHFYGGTTDLYPNSEKQLDRLAEWLTNNESKIVIEGHVNLCSGCRLSKSKAFQLSDGRASRVYNYLIRSGISSLRLKRKGYGTERPIHPDPKTANQNAENRRVEFLVYAN